jgi:hypothetical protein
MLVIESDVPPISTQELGNGLLVSSEVCIGSVNAPGAEHCSVEYA